MEKMSPKKHEKHEKKEMMRERGKKDAMKVVEKKMSKKKVKY